MTQTNSQIREEIINKLQNEWGVDNRESDSFDNWVSGLLLLKIDELLKLQREEIIEKIERIGSDLGDGRVLDISWNKLKRDIINLIKNN